MKPSGLFILSATGLFLSACAARAPDPMSHAKPEFSSPEIAGAAAGTILLVSLEDGTVIRQTIDVDAEICFKQNSASLTTCFSQGDAILDPVTQQIIGYEMIEGQIDLVARSD